MDDEVVLYVGCEGKFDHFVYLRGKFDKKNFRDKYDPYLKLLGQI